MMIILGGTLGSLGNNFWNYFSILLNSLFWFVGIHWDNVVNIILNLIWLINSDINRLILQVDNATNLSDIITAQFMDNFVYIGDDEYTIGLVIVIAIMARRKAASKVTKTIILLTLVTGIFNINEQPIFELPTVMNFSLLIPFILTLIVNVKIDYSTMASGLIVKTTEITVS